MIFNTPAQLPKAQKTYDHVVVGSGPVGITIALNLANNGKKILLLEGGSENYETTSQNRYSGKVTGLEWDKHKYLDGLRLRYLGGTSNHWVGYCLKLEPDDLERWPISQDDLYRHSRAAEEILDIGSFEDHQKMMDENWSRRKNPSQFHQPRVILRSPPVRFKEKYGKTIKEHPQIHICLNANVTDISLSNDLSSISELTVRESPNSPEIRVPVQRVIFCMGAIECTRFMLILKGKYKNKRDWSSIDIGSGFLEHPHYDWDDAAAYCISPKNTLKDNGYAVEQEFSKIKFSPAIRPLSPLKHKQGILNYAFTIFKPQPAITLTEAEKQYFSFVQKIRDKEQSGKQTEHDIHMINLQTEMDAQANNRIHLSITDKDDFGLPRAGLHIQMSDAVKKTAKTALDNLQRDLIELGCTLIRAHDRPQFFMGGAHPMATTRMGSSSDSGFVDQNLKIFGISNAYVCSGSVFASGGYANPTFTLVNLALRLADHLNKKEK